MDSKELKPESFVTDGEVKYSFDYHTNTACKITVSSISYEFEGSDIRFLIEAFNEVEILRANQQTKTDQLKVALKKVSDYNLRLETEIEQLRKEREPLNAAQELLVFILDHDDPELAVKAARTALKATKGQ